MKRKRSERQAQSTSAPTTERPKTERVPAKPTGEYRSALCPVCGRTAGKKRRGYPYQPGESAQATQNYWEWISDKDKERGLGKDEPFGVIQEVGAGKGHSFRVIGYFAPEDDEDGFYPLIKARLLQAVRRWLENGWLTKEEVADLTAVHQP